MPVQWSDDPPPTGDLEPLPFTLITAWHRGPTVSACWWVSWPLGIGQGANLYPLLLPEGRALDAWLLATLIPYYFFSPMSGTPSSLHIRSSQGCPHPSASASLCPTAQLPPTFIPRPYLAQMRKVFMCTVSLWFLAWNKFFFWSRKSRLQAHLHPLGRAQHVEGNCNLCGR